LCRRWFFSLTPFYQQIRRYNQQKHFSSGAILIGNDKNKKNYRIRLENGRIIS